MAKQFPRGKYRVRTADDAGGSNFLELLEHVRFVVRGPVQHSADVDSPALDPDNMKFICVDLTTSEFSTIASVTPNAVEIFIARENQNHFLPLRLSNTPLQALRAWNTNVPLTRAAEAAEARRLAAESDAAVCWRASKHCHQCWHFLLRSISALFVLPRSIQRVASSDRLSSGTTMMDK